MNTKQARKIAIESVNNISQPGELVPVVGTVIVGIDWQGEWWVTDNGEDVVGLSKEQAVETIIENLTASKEE